MKLDISYKNLLLTAIPVCLGAFVQFILVLTDNLFLSRLDGEEMNGAATIGLVYITFAILGNGLGGGTQILVARRTGEGNYSKGGETLANALFLSIALATLLFICLHFICPLFFSSWIKDAEIRDVMNRFLSIRSWGVFFYVPTAVINGFFIGISKPRILAISSGIAAIVNILLCWLFVFGKGGIPAMHAEGAALATLISEFIALCVVLVYTYNSNFEKVYSILAAIRTKTLKHSAAILRISGPLMLQLLLSLAIWTVFFFFVEKLGSKQMKASHIIRSTYLLALISIMGFSQTTRTVVSTLMAEKRTGEIPCALKRLMILNIGGILLLVHGLVLYPRLLAGFFTSDPLTLEYTINSMFVVFPAMLIFAITSILLNTIEGSGNTLAGFLIEVGTSIFYFTVAWYFTIRNPHPVHYAWLSDLVYFGCIGVFSLIYLKKSQWRTTTV